MAQSLARLATGVVLTVAVLVSITGLLKRQEIYDWWRLRGYEPPARIAELAERTTMTPYGRKLFYVHHPQLNDRGEFNQNCAGFEQTIVLGCYLTHTSIYIFDVTDPRLEGIEEVTAAHEMLHAAYDRLNQDEKNNINNLTADFLLQLKDERIQKVVESYKKRDPRSVPSELHSILATEVGQLNQELEEYYAKYFSNREAVAQFSAKYEAVFTQQQNKIQELNLQIDRFHAELAVKKLEIEAAEAKITDEANRLEQLRTQNNIESYNSAVPGYNQMVENYRNLIATYNKKVKRLNELVAEHNSLAVEQKQLIDAINSKEPTP